MVTGGAGYIGSHAAKALLDAGYHVVVYDDLSAGHSEAVSAVESAGDVSLVVGDIRDTAAVQAALREHDVSAVLHFAAWLSVGDSVADPLGYYDNNVGGALSVVRAMVSERVTRLVFSSTCAVYGEPDETPIVETHPTRPVNAYGATSMRRALTHPAPWARTTIRRSISYLARSRPRAVGRRCESSARTIRPMMARACGITCM